MSKKGAIRLTLDMVKWDDWNSSLDDIRKREDKCSPKDGQRDMLLETLIRVHEEGCGGLHMLCTSRREVDIAEALESIFQSPSNIDIDLLTRQEMANRDIGLYIDNTYDTQPFKRWPDDIKSEAKVALIEKAGGM